MAVILDSLANLIKIKTSNFLGQPKFQILLDKISITSLFLNNLNHQQLVDFYKIIVLLLKIQLTKQEFLVKIVHFSNKIVFLSHKVNRKSNQFKEVKIRNLIQNNLATKIIKVNQYNK